MHELGHSVVARYFGVPILGITLLPFGGMARMAGHPAPRQELLIAAAGPATSITIGSFSLMAWTVTGVGVLGVLASINLVLGVFNLLPALPMDGGRMLRAWLAGTLGYLRATLIAGRLARVLAVFLALSAIWIGPMVFVIAILLWFMAGQEMGAARARAWAERARWARAQSPHGTASFEDDISRFVSDLRARAAQHDRPRSRSPEGDVPASRVVIDAPPRQ